MDSVVGLNPPGQEPRSFKGDGYISQNWSARAPERQIATLYYERLFYTQDT